MFPYLHDEGHEPLAMGRKAANLASLAAVGVRVPAGFVIAPEVPIAALAEAALAEAVAAVGGFPVAVRSSGLLEDLSGASFAGQYESILNVADLAQLQAAIARCRASASTERVAAYALAKGMERGAEPPKLAVLVQRMVDAIISGVAFSIDPMTGREEHARVELCCGLGDRLVGGEVTPTQLVIDLRDCKTVSATPGQDGAALTPDQTTELRRVLLTVQAHFGSPQDVEWCIDEHGRVVVVQSRPITSINWRDDVAEVSNASFKDGGVSARVCTPLMYSLYERPFNAAMQAYLLRVKLLPRNAAQRDWILFYYGRAYWNAAAVKERLFNIPGFDEASFDRDIGINKTYGPAGPRVVPTNVRTVVPALPIAFALKGVYKRLPAEMRAAKATLLAEEASWRAAVDRFAETSDAVFFADVGRVLLGYQFRAESCYFTTVYAQSNLQSDVETLLSTLGRRLGTTVELPSLMGGLTDVSHMRLQTKVLELYAVAAANGTDTAAFAKALGRFLETEYFHANIELDLTVPRWGERPADAQALIERMLATGTAPSDPRVTSEQALAACANEQARLEGLIRAKPYLRVRYLGKLRAMLATMRQYLVLREDMRECSTKAYAVARLYVLEAGRRLAAADRLDAESDVFMLRGDELSALAAASAPDTLRSVAKHRRQMYAGYRDFVAPDEFGQSVQAAPAQAADAASWRGIGASAGIVEGTARIILSPTEAHLLKPGDILVTPYTDPAWTPILALAAGVVTEVGGLLSHGAVISREYGIPAVLNLNGATKVIRSGQRLRLDGRTGIVTPLETAKSAAEIGQERTHHPSRGPGRPAHADLSA